MELNRQEFTAELKRIFDINGLAEHVTDASCDKFYRLTVRMLEENEKYNLTAITEPKKIILNHYADCAKMAKYLHTGASIVDIGCGAGFPTLPLAIIRDDIKITAVDSTAKRVRYVEETAALLDLTNVTCEVMRAEDGGKNAKYREKFDYATARAVAAMPILAELCLPYVRVGGKMVAMKGRNAEDELAAARHAISALGGESASVEEVTLTDGGGEEISHPLISIRKKSRTPQNYPRAYSQISKKPL